MDISNAGDGVVVEGRYLGTGPIAARASRAPNVWLGGLAAGVSWLTAALLTVGWPDITEWERSREFGIGQGLIGIALIIAGVGASRLPRAVARLRPLGPWLVALPVLLSLWQVVTAKLALLPLPFFVPPQALLEVYMDDYARLGESIYRSLLLLAPGYFIGAAVGFLVGVALGWSKAAAYWGHPVVRLIGPLPATAWLPLAFFFFPTSYSASTFLIALATAFPVSVLTSSGIASVNSAYYDIARTLGARQRFLVLHVAIPAAMPSVFVGLFMGLGSSFAVLIVAEMMGVKAGLGWYLQWAQGWAAYGNMYAALLVMALLFSSIITLLFVVRDRLLAWQKGLVRW